MTRHCGSWPRPGYSRPLWGSHACRTASVAGKVYVDPSKAKTDRPCHRYSSRGGKTSYAKATACLSKVSNAWWGILARALVSALRCGLCPSGHRPLRRAKVRNSPSLVATPLSRPLATSERSPTISCASGSLRRREKSWARRLVIVSTNWRNRRSSRSYNSTGAVVFWGASCLSSFPCQCMNV